MLGMWHDATPHHTPAFPSHCRATREEEGRANRRKGKKRKGKRVNEARKRRGEERGDENDPRSAPRRIGHVGWFHPRSFFSTFFHENYLSYISPSPRRKFIFYHHGKEKNKDYCKVSTTINNPLVQCFFNCWETEKRLVSQSVALIRDRLLPPRFSSLVPATSVTPRARPQELVPSERELARHARGIRVARLA